MPEHRVLALDLSTTSTGWAVGAPGGKPEIVGTIRPANDPRATTPASRMLTIARAVSGICKAHGCTFVIAEQLNSDVNMNTTRVLGQVAGAVMVIVRAEQGLDVHFMNTS